MHRPIDDTVPFPAAPPLAAPPPSGGFAIASPTPAPPTGAPPRVAISNAPIQRVHFPGPALPQPQDDTLVVNDGGQNPTETIGDGDQPLDAAYDNQWTLSDVDVHQ